MPLDRRTIATFLGLAFAISWTTAGLLYLFDVDLVILWGQGLLVVFFMWGPALAALLVQRGRPASIRSACRLRVGARARLVAAWVAPLALLGLVVLLGLCPTGPARSSWPRSASPASSPRS